MGGTHYVIDVRPHGVLVMNARHFTPNGYDFDALCRAGRISVSMRGSKRDARRIVSREIQRQAMRTACDLKTCDAKAEANERYPTNTEWEEAALQRADFVASDA
jgi:hypothetical protein